MLTYLGTIALDHPGSVIPFLFDRFELTLEDNPCCDLDFGLSLLDGSATNIVWIPSLLWRAR